jgi:hypothetical protein
MKQADLGKTKKIRTISFDTDLVSDILPLRYLLSKSKLTKDESGYLERCKLSFQILSLTLSVRVEKIGTELIERELSKVGGLKILYDRIFQRTIEFSSAARKLANAYLEKRNIKPADALLLALITIGNVDCFLSWNRQHIVNSETLKILRQINEKRNLRTPLILTPKDFLERITLSPERAICFYVNTVPSEFRPQFYLSKQIL